MSRAGARKLFVKTLAPNDNSKNQVYLAGGFSVLNQLPTQTPEPQEGNKTLWAKMQYQWLQTDGSARSAPAAKLILYPQYPEVRLSGFLQGCKGGPNDLFNPVKLGRTPGRVLFLGVTEANMVLAFAAAANTKIASEVVGLKAVEDKSTLLQLPLTAKGDGRAVLLAELKRIHELGWIVSKGLRADGTLQPCQSPNCVGYTLEAELGVARNGRSEPDYLGWEIKASQVKSLSRPPTAKAQTLFTPEPNGGFYKTEGAAAFVRRYGYADRNGRDDRLNFGGVFRNKVRAQLTGLTLELDGYDAAAGKISNPSGAILLLDDAQNVAASWSFPALLALWSRKHGKAAYVPAEKSEVDWQYRYGAEVRLAIGTDFLLFLEAVQVGAVYYDPGIKIEEASSTAPKLKRRSQFRIGSKGIVALCIILLRRSTSLPS
ncbi:MAG: MvaI/BcnI restriction endonuclease family protein [Hyphomonadaceae bacterium]|nr:MvaI/BcnI restriction endonuclease family protein [Hyphomonadaceae bacterium]